jgi:threonylcarbamoyladenosine tRNA methylthiotransferase MtaB
MSDNHRTPTAAILTLGCKLNIADSEVVARRLRESGWDIVQRLSDAEAVVVNTCSVTHTADQKSRHYLRLARRAAPKATVALTGCLLETVPREQIDALGADLVYHQPDQLALAEKLIELMPFQPVHGDAVRQRTFKTRAFISAQEGCNDLCAFCIIPRTRGRERSRSVDWLIEQTRKREAEGIQEIVITGTQLGAYGRDRGDVRLYDLMRALLAETSVPRIRMSSVQPQDLDDDLIGLWQDARLCRHFHLALQSGSATTLQRMRRRYTQQDYRDAVRRLRDAIPDVAITTDVIVGFPGETDAEFDQSFDFCHEMSFAGIHVFPYSQRSGTAAFKMTGQVPDATKKARVRRLIELASAMSQTYRERFLGSTTPVLWENRRNGGWEGLTDTYIRVRTQSSADLTNRLIPVRLTATGEDGLTGEVTT